MKKKKPDCCDIAELLGAAKINFEMPKNPTAIDDMMHYGQVVRKSNPDGTFTRIDPTSIIIQP